MIHIHDLSKTYNGVTVLKIDELQIPKGESFGLVGNNGAGKTTLFSALYPTAIFPCPVVNEFKAPTPTETFLWPVVKLVKAS